MYAVRVLYHSQPLKYFNTNYSRTGVQGDTKKAFINKNRITQNLDLHKNSATLG